MARKPETAKGGIGHNSGNTGKGEFSEEEFLSAVRTHDALKEACANANAAFGRFRKELKTRGYKMKNFDAVLGEREIDRKEIKQDLAQQMQMRRWLNLPTGTQSELFPADAPKPTEDAAYLDGFTKGVAGKGMGKPPEEFGSGKQQQSWLKGWNDGQAKLGNDVFGKKDFTKPPPESVKAAGPSAAKSAGKNVVNLADKREATKAPTVPEAAEKPKEKPAKPADKKADKNSPEAVVARVAASKKKPTKAELAAEGGGVGGMAPAGARKGGGDFEDEPVKKKAAAAKDDDLEDDLDLDLEDA
jgi:ribosome modulation factor